MKLSVSHGGRNRLRVLREVFGSERDEVAVEGKGVGNEQLYHLHCSLNIVRLIKSRRMKWAWHVRRMGGGEGHAGFWWGRPRVRVHLEDLGIDGRIILKWMLGKWDGEAWAGLIWLRIGIGGGRV